MTQSGRSVQGKKIEVRYYGDSEEVLHNLIGLATEFTGIVLYYEQNATKTVEISVYENKVLYKVLPENVSYMSMRWAIIDILEKKKCQQGLTTAKKTVGGSGRCQGRRKSTASKRTSTGGSAFSVERATSVTSKQRKPNKR